MKTITGKSILNVKMQDNDAEAETIGDYLQTLLLDLWIQGEGFDSKRPFGNSCWAYELYEALVAAGLVEGYLDEDGYIESADMYEANNLIKKAILAMYKLPKK